MAWSLKKIDVDKLETLYNDGLTYSQMAGIFGCEKGAVSCALGKLRKSGRIGYRPPQVKKERHPRKTRARKPSNSTKNRASTKIRPNTTLSWKNWKIKHVPWDYESETGKTILDLKPHDCRWPCKDGLFCGKISATGKSYCEEHLRKSKT